MTSPSMEWIRRGATSLVLCCAGCDVAPTALVEVTQPVTLSQVASFGSNPGNLKMFAYVPAALPAGAPLVVAMHGCTESAQVYSTQTEWGALADRFRFAVVFPEQQTANNSSSCFNWFQPGDIARGQGEALSIKQMVDAMIRDHGSDAARVFATGMSAGGFMTEVMMAAYPDVFAGGAVNSGGPYACATSLTATTSCQQGNVVHSPQQWGDLVRQAVPGYAGPFPRLIAFHGSADFTVAAADLQQSIDQWSNVLGVDDRGLPPGGSAAEGRRGLIDETPELSETFRTATHRVFRDAGGRSMIETYLVSGMGHALTVDPGTNPDQGGATGAFCEDHDIYSSFYAAQFFGLTAAAGGGSSDAGVDAGGSDARLDAGGSDAGGAANQLETFSTAAGPDSAGWSFGGWTLSTKDATGTPGSRSLTATAAPSFTTVTRTATWAGLAIGAATRLSYVRQLALTDANINASASFRVIINDGTDHVVDAQSITGLASFSEPSFTARTAIDLSAFAGKTVSLKLVVTASDLASIVTSATATVDQIALQ
jgi:poly(hydroxyalkanoate) depolymerase family esterase